MKKCLVLLTVFVIVFSQDTAGRPPLYKYRIETEDVMQTDATTIPVRGYHVVEGGYYPQIGLGGVGGGFGGAGGIGLGGAGLGYKAAGIAGGIGGAGLGYGVGGIGGGAGGFGYGGIGAGGIGYGGGAGLALKSVAPIGLGVGGAGIGLGGAGIGAGGAGIGLGGAGLIGAGGAGIGLGGAGIGAGGAGLIGAPLLHHGYGGEFVGKNLYSGGKKNLNDLKFEKVSGKGGEEFGAGNEGFSKGVAAIQDAKGQTGYYNDQAGGKKALEDGKVYYGGQHYNQQGKNGGEVNEKAGHKKGHVIKGYKSSHHKDETGKTEEFYDEAHDEGGKLNFKGESGSFGQLGSQSYKGGHENDEFFAGGRKNQGQFNSQHVLDNTKANHGGYGEKKFGGSGSVYGVNNGVDEQSLLGHQESTGFYKHHPHLPFY